MNTNKVSYWAPTFYSINEVAAFVIAKRGFDKVILMAAAKWGRAAVLARVARVLGYRTFNF